MVSRPVSGIFTTAHFDDFYKKLDAVFTALMGAKHPHTVKGVVCDSNFVYFIFYYFIILYFISSIHSLLSSCQTPRSTFHIHHFSLSSHLIYKLIISCLARCCFLIVFFTLICLIAEKY
jgi:hypothetical protein